MSLDRLALRSLRARPLRDDPDRRSASPSGSPCCSPAWPPTPASRRPSSGTVRDLVGRADLRVAAFGETGLSPETVAAIAGDAGRRRSPRRPSSGGPTSGRASASGDALPPPVTVLGIDPTVDGRLHDLAIVAGSRARSTRTEPSALITERLAAQDGLTVGSPLTMQGAGDARSRYRVVGIVARRRAADRGVRPDGRRPARTAQAVFGDDRRHPGRHRTRPATPISAAVSAALESRLGRAVRPVLAARTSPPRCGRRPRTSRRRPRSSPRSRCSPARSSSSTRCR